MTEQTELDCCPICEKPFKAEDVCADDITEGTCHAECLEGSPVVDLQTGDELPDGKADTYLYRDVMAPPPETHVAGVGLLPIYAEGGIGARLMEAMEAYRKDYVFSPDDGWDHDPTEFEKVMLEDFMNGAFNEQVTAILQEAARAAMPPSPPPQDQAAGSRPMDEASLPNTSRLSQLEARTSCAASVNDQLMPPSPQPQDHVQAYRFLAEGDLIEATDEFNGNDGQTWVRPDGWEVGMKYPSRVFKSARRLVSPPSPDQTTEAQ